MRRGSAQGWKIKLPEHTGTHLAFEIACARCDNLLEAARALVFYTALVTHTPITTLIREQNVVAWATG